MTTYYVKNGGSDSADGLSDSTAWATVGKVNSFSFATSDDVYFKCGSTFTDAELTVDWNGTSGNRANVGAYYLSGGSEVVGVSGNKPIIDGGWNGSTYSHCFHEDPLIRVDNVDYVTVKDIKCVNQLGRGIDVYGNTSTAQSPEILRCDVENIFSAGILFYSSVYDGLIEDCTATVVVKQYQLGCTDNWGLGISAYKAPNTVIRRCVVDRCGGEGLGVWSSTAPHADNCIMEDNEVFAARAVGIYINNVQGNIVRRNLVYGTTDSTYHREGGAVGWAFGEADEYSSGRVDNNAFYNNLAAFASYGTLVGSPSTNLKFYHNTFVDCNTGFGILGADTGWVIKNNIVANYYGSGAMTSGADSGIDWDYNHWHSTPEANAQGANDTSGNPLLSKTSGWRSISSLGGITAYDFALTTSSPCIDAGLDISTYSDEDYFEASRGTLPDIGAIEYGYSAGITSTAVIQAVGSSNITSAASIIIAQSEANFRAIASTDDSDATISSQSGLSGVAEASVTANGLVTMVFSTNIVLTATPEVSGSISASASLTGRGRSRMVDKRTLGNKRAVVA